MENYSLLNFVFDLTQLYLQGKDAAALQLVLEKWDRDKGTVDLNNVPKSREKAIEKIVAGKKLFASSPSSTDKLLEIYTDAIVHAPNYSTELARAYGSRSAVLCNARLYEESLLDINRALVLNYPAHLKAKLFARRATSLSAIAPEKQAEIKEAIAAARRWIRKMNDTNKKLLESKLNELSTQKSFEEPYKKPDNSIIVPDIIDANEKLIGASSAIQLKHSRRFGRHIVANRDIKAGETLANEKTYVSLVHCSANDTNADYTFNLNSRLSYCWNCSKRTWASIPCKHCSNVVYCSNDCQNDAWKKFHDFECPILNCIKIAKTFDIELVALRMTVKAVKEAGSVKLLNEKLKSIHLMSDPCTPGFTEDKLNGAFYASFYTLKSDYRCESLSHFYIGWLSNVALMLFAWANTVEPFESDINTMADLLTSKEAMFMGQLMIDNLRICYMNAQQTKLYNKKEAVAKRVTMGCLINYFNHSCDPNAACTYSGDIMAVHCIQPIKKGEQIFINYLMYDKTKPIEFRQKFLQDYFNFRCECILCRDKDWHPLHSLSRSFKDQFLPPQVEKMLEKEVSEFINELKSTGSKEDFDDKLCADITCIPSLLDILNTLYKYINHPCSETWTFKNALIQNYIRNSS